MTKKTIKDIQPKGKLVFLRLDLNVPLDDHGKITDDTRIRETVPTIRHLVSGGARVVLGSHMGRPKGEKKPRFSLKPVARRLGEILSTEVQFTGETTGSAIEQAKDNLKEGELLLLENLRFAAGETGNDREYAKQLSRGIDIFVNDAFGACHRSHASITAITDFIPLSVAGLLLEKEINFLKMALDSPPAKTTLILGGAKVSDKIPVVRNLINQSNAILIGGAMAYTFLKSRGIQVGNSIVDENALDICSEMMKESDQRGGLIHLPVDHVAAIKIEPNITVKMTKSGEDIPDNMMGLDIGIETIKTYTGIIGKSELIIWNGPMGVFEVNTFSAGTMEIAKAVASANATTIIGGGDSVAAVNQAGVADKITHISTGGGASLEFLSGKELPGIAALSDK